MHELLLGMAERNFARIPTLHCSVSPTVQRTVIANPVPWKRQPNPSKVCPALTDSGLLSCAVISSTGLQTWPADATVATFLSLWWAAWKCVQFHLYTDSTWRVAVNHLAKVGKRTYSYFNRPKTHNKAMLIRQHITEVLLWQTVTLTGNFLFFYL